MLVYTTAAQKIKQQKKRVRIIQGGTSSSKTFSILLVLIAYAEKVPLSEISVVSESVPHLKRGAIKDFIKIMNFSERFEMHRFNRTDLRYKFENGSFIEFFSVEQPDKLRGARRDVLFINECNNIPFEAYQQLAIRTKKFIYLDYNPSHEFWVHKELINDEDSSFIVLTYKDNEALDPAIVKEIEKAKEKAETSNYWANWWKVYGLGELGSLEGVVLSNWKQIDTIPKEARLLGYGLDFGFTADPTACIAIYKYNDKIIADEVLYQKGLHNNEIASKLKECNAMIYADKAEPKSISELQRYGLKIMGAEKGADSIIYGIQLLQQQDLLVTSQSLNLIKELRNYVWKKDKNGQQIPNKPIDDHNHAIDALRYAAMEILGNKSSGKYVFR